ncbi:MAG: glycosyltransferase family 2 protein [Gammaproteobacteria bacterium]
MPVYNASGHLPVALSALKGAIQPGTEIIVVDDASEDDSVHIAEAFGAQVIQQPGNLGPAAARNRGAAGQTADILCFVDADVRVSAASFQGLIDTLQADASLAAVFGAYDTRPFANGLVSHFRNLLHHYTHQTGNPEAATFWSGFGAIRREAFESVGGFDEDGYTRRAMEDVELGYQLRRAGFRIRLAPEWQCTHLKHWGLGEMARTDLLHRAIPWSRLIMDRRVMPDDLNVSLSQRLSVALTLLLVPMLLAELWLLESLWIVLLALCAILVLNRGWYRFLLCERGLGFTMAAFPLHLIYFAVSGLGFMAAWFFPRQGDRGS